MAGKLAAFLLGVSLALIVGGVAIGGFLRKPW